MNFSLIATLTTAHALLHYCHHWLLALLFSKLLVSTLIFSFFSSLPVPDTFHYYRDLPRLNSPSRRYLRSGRLSTIFFSHFPHASHTFSFLLNTIVDRISNLNVIEIPVITVFLVWLTGRNERINTFLDDQEVYFWKKPSNCNNIMFLLFPFGFLCKNRKQ